LETSKHLVQHWHLLKLKKIRPGFTQRRWNAWLCSCAYTYASESKLSATKGVLLDEKEATAYRRLIGRLIYLTNTRPDITFSVNHFIQFVSKPTNERHQAAMCVLRYPKNAPGKGIFFYSQTSIQLKAYSDSDWATCPETRKSITSFSVYLGESLISWKSKKLQTI